MQFTASQNNFALGRGQVFFAAFLPGTRTPGPELYFGNTPDLKINTTSETLEHFSSESGVKEVDDAATLKTTRKLSLKTDNVSPQNLALLFLGSASALTVSSVTATAEAIVASRVVKDGFFALGVTPTNLSGVMNVTHGSVAIKTVGGSPTTYVEGTDYEVIYASGMVHVLPTGAIVSGVALTADYACPAYTRDAIISGSSPIEGQIRFISENVTGKDINYFIPYARISPNGEFALKGDTWQELDFQGDILKLSPSAVAVHIDGRTFLA
jgi:hypothetical protein